MDTEELFIKYADKELEKNSIKWDIELLIIIIFYYF